MPVSLKYNKLVIDFIITLSLWIYFIFGYLILFFPVYLITFLFSANREIAFQKLNCIFFKGFFFLAKALLPQLELCIQDEVLNIRSKVIFCNHISYLDPILLVSLFEKHKTIGKSILFKIPFFSWLLKTSGYIPPATSEALASLMIKHVENMEDYLSSGGNLFIFPEGTRSRNGQIGRFEKGGFRIARRCNAPIKVLFIKNTNILFPPGKFLFNTNIRNTIEIKLIDSIKPDYKSKSFSISCLMDQVYTLFEKENLRNTHG